MRDKLNSSPIAQVALVGVLGLVVAFLLMTRMGGSSEPAPEEASTSSTDPAAEAATADAAAATAAGDTATGAPVTSAGTDPTAVTPTADTASVAASAGRFVAGPGLPDGVVKAYADGKVVMLLVTRHDADADRKLRAAADHLRSRGDVALFETSARHVSDYSRIAQGVDLNRVPALVALRPRELSKGELPEASISYGYRGPDSVVQAVRDAAYNGRSDIPYYPE